MLYIKYKLWETFILQAELLLAELPSAVVTFLLFY